MENNDATALAMLQAAPTVPTTERRVRQVAMRLMTGHAQKESLNVQRLREELSRIQGQDTITAKLVETLHRDDLGVFPRTTPIAWLFAGASGVGKTEVAKIIAQELTEQPPIILNMTEFHSPASINRIIGSPAGYVGSTSNAELPFDCLESNPYRVILLDEIEKSDKSVQRLFLSAFDEGRIRTSQGKEVDFSKAIVIATTNAAKETMSKKPVGFGIQTPPTYNNLVRDLEQHFDTEFLARFSEILGFNPLNSDTYREILRGSYVRERERILKDQPRKAALLPATIPDDELHTLSDKTYLESQGARPAERAARRHIEDILIAAAAQNAAAALQPWAAGSDGDAEDASDTGDAGESLDAGEAPAEAELLAPGDYSESHP
jgi:ATP-dependent Clp protease ATP-binding subunit ClpB